MRKVVVTGGAGYIGSHFAHFISGKGYEVVILDDLSLGHAKAAGDLPLAIGNVGDPRFLDSVFGGGDVDAVVHFAAYSKVAESMTEPAKYYQNNVCAGLELLKGMERHGVNKLVFSSTCALYGEPETLPITEENQKIPINPYGATKLCFERMAMDLAAVSTLRPVFLRYFNAAGADPEGRLGEDHDPETHLIPLILQTALGQRESVSIFGSDYPTDDGSCVRDYIHVTDLADAHLKALEYLDGGGAPDAFNMGAGKGSSVLQVVEAARRVTGLSISTQPAPRRPGDPSTLISSSEKAMRVLGWRPEYTDIDIIIETAWHWMKENPDGYDR
ncbi:MAG: UDP-glucose 4-epimerase GalE [Nitrospinota bacterium]|nr:UDP-glucose 4-epimerase GalE [Nitrospinota bacterium]